MPQVFRRAGIEAAKVASRSAEMDAAAAKVLAKAKIAAAQHRQTGAYIASLKITEVRGKSGTRDRLISAYDPASISIEFGHFERKVTKHTKSRRVSTGTLVWVPGQYIMTKARGLL